MKVDFVGCVRESRDRRWEDGINSKSFSRHSSSHVLTERHCLDRYSWERSQSVEISQLSTTNIESAMAYFDVLNPCWFTLEEYCIDFLKNSVVIYTSMNFLGFERPRLRRKSYAAPGTLYDIPDTDKPVDFYQEQMLIKTQRDQRRRGSVPARTTVGGVCTCSRTCTFLCMYVIECKYRLMM